jgi:epidermal growth factor receptor substrate 15
MPCFEEDIKKASVRCGRGFSYWDTMNPNGQHVTKQAGKQALSGKHTGKVQEGTVSQAGAGSRPSSKQAAKQAAKQASKQASKPASRQQVRRKGAASKRSESRQKQQLQKQRQQQQRQRTSSIKPAAS